MTKITICLMISGYHSLWAPATLGTYIASAMPTLPPTLPRSNSSLLTTGTQHYFRALLFISLSVIVCNCLKIISNIIFFKVYLLVLKSVFFFWFNIHINFYWYKFFITAYVLATYTVITLYFNYFCRLIGFTMYSKTKKKY